MKLLCCLLLSMACAHGQKPLPAAKDAVITCALDERGLAIGAATEVGLALYRTVISSGEIPVDKDRIADAIVGLGATAGGCWFADFVRRLHKEPSGTATQALAEAPDVASEILERVRARFGGVRWQMPDGVVQ